MIQNRVLRKSYIQSLLKHLEFQRNDYETYETTDVRHAKHTVTDTHSQKNIVAGFFILEHCQKCNHEQTSKSTQ